MAEIYLSGGNVVLAITGCRSQAGSANRAKSAIRGQVGLVFGVDTVFIMFGVVTVFIMFGVDTVQCL